MFSPNLYQLQGAQLSIAYATGVAEGLGPFFYQDPHQTLTFPENELRIVATEIGTLVTVTLHRATVLNLGSTTFTLLVPDVNLEGEFPHPVSIQTIGITTLHRPALPPFNRGQTEVYTTTQLTGTATYLPL